MAKYSDIKGFTVQTVSSDPVASQISGGSWSSGGNLPGPRDETTGAGTLTAGIQFGGYSPPESAYKPETFEYNGTAWTEGGDMSNARSNFGGLGTQTAALAIGGQNPAITANVTEEYDGSSWTAGGTLPTPLVSNYGATGTQTAGLMIGGFSPATPGAHAETLVYNGSSWSDTGHDVPATLDRNGATGTSTAAMTGGGRAPSATNAFNIYNGSSWTSITNYPTSGYHFQLQGPYTDTIVSGGYPLNTNSNWWDGTSWTSAPSMSNNHGQAAKANSTAGATSGDGFVAGADPSSLNGTEHWNSAPPVFTKQVEGQLFFNSTTNTFKETITDFPGATWGSAASMNQNRGRAGFSTNVGTPTTHAAFVYSGNTGPGSPGKTVNAEQYNGTSWTEVAEVNSVRGTVGGGGTLTASTFAGGEIPASPSNSSAHEQWDGSSWTETTELNVARRANVGFGATSGAVLQASGYTTTAVAITEQWDGSSWSEKSDQNEANYGRGGTGTVTDGILFGGWPQVVKTETWDGTSWTEVSELNTGAEYRAPSGNSSALVMASGGYASTFTANVEFWNGTSWTEIANIGTARSNVSGTGSATTGMAIGGQSGPPTQITTVEETTVGLGNKTITTS